MRKHRFGEIVGKTLRAIGGTLQHDLESVCAPIDAVSDRPEHVVQQREAAEGNAREHSPAARSRKRVEARQHAAKQALGEVAV